MLTDEESLLIRNTISRPRTFVNNTNQVQRYKIKTQMDMVNNPPIIPCIHGKELDINTELVGSCLSAISIKVQRKNQCNVCYAQDDLQPANKFERRNSFFNLHRPEITMLNFALTSPHKIEQFFHEHATDHGSYCASLHTGYNPEEPRETNQLKCLHPPTNFANDEEEMSHELRESGSLESKIGPNHAIPLTDEDLEPIKICHRNRAQFCFMIRNIGTVTRPRLEDANERAIPLENKLDEQTIKMKELPSLSRSEFVSQVDMASEKGTDDDELSLSSATSVPHVENVLGSQELVLVIDESAALGQAKSTSAFVGITPAPSAVIIDETNSKEAN